jgi:ABC-type transporter Mla subunit MlaD
VIMAADRQPRRILPIESAAAQRRAGRVMVGVAVVGVLVALTGALLGWHLVGELDETTRESLDVTVESLDSLGDTIDLADELVGSTVDALAAVGDSLEALSEAFDSGSGVITEVGSLAGTLAPALADTTTTLRDLEEVGAAIDEMLIGLSEVPFAPNYDPEAGLGETLATLADTLEPLSAEFASASADLETFTDDVAALRGTIATLGDTVEAVNTDLAGSAALIEEYRLRVERARALAETTRDDLDDDTAWMRFLILLGALNFAVGQIVPLWFGHELLERSRAA